MSGVQKGDGGLFWWLPKAPVSFRAFAIKDPRPLFFRAVLLLVIGCLFPAVSGCSDGRPRRVKVAGRVLIDGQPLPLGSIRVLPADARAATGRIESDGSFVLTTFEKEDGCVPGTHGVEVTAFEPISGSAIRWLAPPKYRQVSESGLTVTITEPTDALVIELTWDGGRPFIERMDSAGDSVPDSSSPAGE